MINTLEGDVRSSVDRRMLFSTVECDGSGTVLACRNYLDIVLVLSTSFCASEYDVVFM